MLMVYVGIACTTTLSKISLPAWVRNFSFQPVMQSQIHPCKLLKALTLDQPIKAGRPKYFSKLSVVLTPAKERISSRTPIGVFLLKKIDVFCLFNLCPDAFLYHSRISCIFSHSLHLALQNNRLSSAKNR